MAKYWDPITFTGSSTDLYISSTAATEQEALDELDLTYPPENYSVGTTALIEGSSDLYFFELKDTVTTIYAYFTTDGGTPSSYTTQSSTSGSLSVTSPGTPTKSGYTFTGWSPSLPRTITTTTTFVAQWAVAQEWVYVLLLDGPADVAIIDETVNNAASAKSALETEYPATSQSLGDTGAVYDEFGPGANIWYFEVQSTAATIYAYFDTDGGTPSSYTTQSTTNASLYVASPGSPTRTGYTFTGWSPSLPTTISTSTTFLAQWSPITYSVRYQPNGGSGTASTQSGRTYDVSFNLTSLSTLGFSRTGYTFLGWSKSSTATVPSYSDGGTVVNLTTTDGSTVDLYAVWELTDPIGIYISESSDYTVSTTANSNSVTINEINPNLVIGMPLVYVSGDTVWQSGTEIQDISYGVSNTTLTLSKHATGTGTSVVKFSQKRISVDTILDANTTTDKIYSRGLKGDRVFEFTASSGWTGGYSHTLVSGRLYKFIDVVGDEFSEYGTVYDAANNLYISNGVQPSAGVAGFVSFKFMPVISNDMAGSFIRISAENSSSYTDLKESKLPIFVGGSTSDSYRLKLIDPNSITGGGAAAYALANGSSILLSTITNALRRSTGSSNAQCYIAMTGGGGGGAGGRDGSYSGPGGGGGGAWQMFRTYFPGIWTSGSAGTGGAGRAVDSSSAGGNGTSSSITGGGNTVTAGGGSGATWSGTSGVGGSGGTASSSGTTISLYRSSIHSINGPSGGNSNADGKGFNGSIEKTGIAVTATTLSHFGNLYLNSLNNLFYYLYNTSLTYVNNGPLVARNGGDSGGLAGHGGGGGASAYANGGRGATTQINSTAGTYGSGGGGGRSALLSGERRPGSNGGEGVIIFFS